MDLSNVQIETDRLRLTPVSEQDLQQIFLEFRLPMTKYMNYTSAGSIEELKETGEFLGCFALEERQNPSRIRKEDGQWQYLARERVLD